VRWIWPRVSGTTTGSRMTDKKRDKTDSKFNVYISDRRKPRPVADWKVVKFKCKDEDGAPVSSERQRKSCPRAADRDGRDLYLRLLLRDAIDGRLRRSPPMDGRRQAGDGRPTLFTQGMVGRRVNPVAGAIPRATPRASLECRDTSFASIPPRCVSVRNR
jgi:hypothetical protein